jgi:hypothetical protein
MKLMWSIEVEVANTLKGCFACGRISSNCNICRVELTSAFGAAEMQALVCSTGATGLCSAGFSSEAAEGGCCVNRTGAQAPFGGGWLLSITVV